MKSGVVDVYVSCGTGWRQIQQNSGPCQRLLERKKCPCGPEGRVEYSGWSAVPQGPRSRTPTTSLGSALAARRRSCRRLPVAAVQSNREKEACVYATPECGCGPSNKRTWVLPSPTGKPTTACPSRPADLTTTGQTDRPPTTPCVIVHPAVVSQHAATALLRAAVVKAIGAAGPEVAVGEELLAQQLELVCRWEGQGNGVSFNTDSAH